MGCEVKLFTFFRRRVSAINRGSFYSPIRDETIALSALIDADPQNKQILVMSKHVTEMLKNRSWYRTQESSFSLFRNVLGNTIRITVVAQ